jgi:beta-1,4-mannosyl-glycoprotein beta-1,4-N-acetylglucosaminyltransferase
MRKIYDAFLFFNELDILELRLNILDMYVDYFVISESSITHSGQPKPYYFEENKERFSKFLHKIIYLKISDTPNDFVNLPNIIDTTTFDGKCVLDIHDFIKTQTLRFNRKTEQHFGRDFFQKECIRRGFVNCNDDDIIISSDLDEIPNPKNFQDIDSLMCKAKFFTFNQTTYYYYFNLLKESNWKGSRMGFYKDLKKYSYNQLRAQNNYNIDNGGWHFSFMGGPEQVKKKIQSYSHQEMNNPHIINSIDNNINNNIDPFFRGDLKLVKIDETYPEYILDNIDKYKNFIK